MTALKKYRWLRVSLAGVLGALVGFGYYYFIGCRTGSCPISGNPYVSTIYGLLLGFLFSYDTKGKSNE
jgi:uncharacterized membrane protein YedE/YeeE